MPVEINEVTVEAAPPPAPARPPASSPGPGSVAPAVADAAERHWKRVADLQERVHAD